MKSVSLCLEKILCDHFDDIGWNKLPWEETTSHLTKAQNLQKYASRELKSPTSGNVLLNNLMHECLRNTKWTEVVYKLENMYNVKSRQAKASLLLWNDKKQTDDDLSKRVVKNVICL